MLARTISQDGVVADEAQAEHVALLRKTWQELSAACEAMRRMVERGCLCYLDTNGGGGPVVAACPLEAGGAR